jgi:hypothetical protein
MGRVFDRRAGALGDRHRPARPAVAESRLVQLVTDQ